MAQAENDARCKTVFHILTRQFWVSLGFEIFNYIMHKSDGIEYDVIYCFFL